ncbi:M10 family metallopeptidase [Sphingomonas arenae]|uniref:M10 family metallopeptidase n=1 Tax=Sphingomonas arenae TaxID=2812555 RepID=UPI0019681BAA|nr:M10 family metallopeptidase [Sphingomonas arenae]
MPDIPASSSTTASVGVGQTVGGTLEVNGDHDWFRIDLAYGSEVTVLLSGVTLDDPYLRIRDASGNVVYENDDINTGVILDSRLTFIGSGTYYIDVGAFDDTGSGTYQLSVTPYTPPTFWTNDQIAGQLVSGYWQGDEHSFALGASRSISVNITGLTQAGRTLALQALAVWSDVTGITFNQVNTGGQIVFDDNESGAFTEATYSGGVTTSAFVNVSTLWLQDYGTGFNSYSLQTYVHEIGHALGLGHAGNYNETANHRYDALFLNDSWSFSVMSYFSQTEAMQPSGAEEAYVLTPMVADILAIQQIYGGPPSGVRAGNTTYGINSNAGQIYNAALHSSVAFTIYDTGGTDTVNYSTFSRNQTINLNPETFSIVGNGGSFSIARGVVIENAVTGSGNDLIVGSAADNMLDGGAGVDTVSYETSTGAVSVNLGLTARQQTGAGNDMLVGFERLVGSSYSDVLTGTTTTTWIGGGAGNDQISGGGGNVVMEGGEGDDLFLAGAGNESFNGENGFDTVDYRNATAGVTVMMGGSLNNTGGSGTDSLGVERVVGSQFADTLTLYLAGEIAEGGLGNDTLVGSSFGLSDLIGGLGDDIYVVRNAGNRLTEVAGQGVDLVRALVSYTLGANLENLTLLQPVYDPYGGASVNPNPPPDDFSGIGNALANVITGNDGDNALSGLAGDDRLYGGIGNDTLDGGRGVDRLYGGAGDDTYVVTDATDYAYELAGEGTDTVQAAVSVNLRANIESLVLTGPYSITGRGNDLENTITGNSGSNRMWGMGGNDTLIGNAGNDFLDGSEGSDTLIGGIGNDVYYVDTLSDTIVEAANEGYDTVRTTLDWTLGAGLDRIELLGSGDLDGTGNGLANILTGNAGANVLAGLDGNDRIFGKEGNDTVDGGAGGDWLEGGTGQDTFIGGTGSDRYVFREGDFGGATTDTADRIVDFGDAEGDRIRLDLIDANTTIAGNQQFAWLGDSAFTGVAGQLRYEQIGGNTYVQGDTNGDGVADFMIRVDGLHTLGTGDFLF